MRSLARLYSEVGRDNAQYGDVLSSSQVILDTIHSMRVVTTREAWYATVRRNFVVPVQAERREMVGNILLYLSLLASAVRLKAPCAPASVLWMGANADEHTGCRRTCRPQRKHGFD